MTRYPERRPHRTKLALMRPIESTDGAWNVIGAEADGRMTALKKKKEKKKRRPRSGVVYVLVVRGESGGPCEGLRGRLF